MTMMNGLDTRDLDMMDEEFFGPPPRFLVEGSSYHEEEALERSKSCNVFQGLGKIRQFIGTW